MQIFDDLTALGDVHLGRKFTTGVPKHRLGEREEMVWKDFENSVRNCTTKYHVQVGDLFDTFVVAPEVVLRAAEIYMKAIALNGDDVFYILYRGNHDASRDVMKKSSFDLFYELMRGHKQIKVVTNDPYMTSDYAFIPWHPFRSAQEQAELLSDRKFKAVFGHFDVESFGGSEFNVIPYETLKKHTDHVVTGHIHKPSEFTHGDMKVTITGSMQPYSHAEDPKGLLYVTLPLSEVLKDSSIFLNKNLRVIVKPEDEVPEIDCLSLILKRETEEEVDEGDIEVEFEDFDISKIFQSCLVNNDVSGEVAELITTKFKELRNL